MATGLGRSASEVASVRGALPVIVGLVPTQTFDHDLRSQLIIGQA